MPRLPENNSIYLNIGVFIVIILAGFALYFVPLQSKFFYYDDHLSIENNTAINKIDIPNIFNVFNTRFLVGLSFAINYKFCALNPAGYRLINLLIHCLNAFLVYLLVKSTLGLIDIRHPDPRRSGGEGSLPGRDSSPLGLRMAAKLQWPAFFAALLFLCHPIQTEAVNLITQRFVLMASFFYLASLCLYVKSRCQYIQCGNRSPRSGEGEDFLSDEAISLKKDCHALKNRARNDTIKFYYICALITALAAMFCKEFVVTLPFMLALYDFYFLSAWAKTWWQRCSRILPFFLIALIVPILLLRTPPQAIGVADIASSHVVQTSNMQKVERHIDITRARGAIGRQPYFLTQIHVVCTYIRLLFWPFNQNFDYDYPLSTKMDIKTALCGAFLLCLLVLAMVTYKSYRLISFGILWFFVSLSVESSFIPIGDVITEYRLYLASVGFVILVMSLIYSRQADLKKLNMIAVAILIGFSILTYQRNKVWRNEFTLWNDTVGKSPHKARPYGNRGIAYVKQGNFTLGLSDYNKAIEINPNYGDAYINRGNLYEKQGNFTQAILDYNKAIAINPNNALAYNNRGLIYDKQGNFALGLSDYNKAIEINPNYADAYNNRAIIYYKRGDFIQAISDYNKAIAIAPNVSEEFNNRGALYVQQSKFTLGLSDLNKAIEINLDNAQAYYNRAGAYYRLRKYDLAWDDVRKAEALGMHVNPEFINMLKKATPPRRRIPTLGGTSGRGT